MVWNATPPPAEPSCRCDLLAESGAGRGQSTQLTEPRRALHVTQGKSLCS